MMIPFLQTFLNGKGSVGLKHIVDGHVTDFIAIDKLNYLKEAKMYKVIKINDSMATRTVELKNEITGTKDLCFDDSALVSIENFEFMKEGEIYSCKIKLFGQFVNKKTEKSVECEIIKEDVTLGNRTFVEVLVNKDIYYILKSKLGNSINTKKFFFEYTRRDLVQVNDVIHNDFL